MKKVHLFFACMIVLSAAQKTQKTAFLGFAGDASTKTVAGFAIDPASIKILAAAPDANGNSNLIAKITVKGVILSQIAPAGTPAPAAGTPAAAAWTTPTDQVMSYNMNGICIGNQQLNLVQDVTAA